MMVDIPCLPSQTFWCLAVPNDPDERSKQPTIEKIILSEDPKYAKRHIENFWNTKCAAILSQEDVQKLLTQLKEFPIKSDATPIPQSSFFDKLMGKSVSQRSRSERFYITGADADGNNAFAIVMAQSLPLAYVEASAKKPGFNPTSGYSETQLSNLLSSMENARTGRINVTRAMSSSEDDRAAQRREIMKAFRGM